MAATILDEKGAARPFKGITMRDAAKVVRVVNTGRIRDAGAVLRLFFSSMQATVTPATLSKTRGVIFSGVTVTIHSPPATINVTGGVPPYTFQWMPASGDGTITADDDTAQTTAFSASIVSTGETVVANAIWEGSVTDASGAKATGQVNVTLTVVDYD